MYTTKRSNSPVSQTTSRHMTDVLLFDKYSKAKLDKQNLLFKKIWLFVLSDNDKTAANEAKNLLSIPFYKPSSRRLRRGSEVGVTHESLNKQRQLLAVSSTIQDLSPFCCWLMRRVCAFLLASFKRASKNLLRLVGLWVNIISPLKI